MFYTIPNQMKFWVTLAGDNRGDSISQNCFFWTKILLQKSWEGTIKIPRSIQKAGTREGEGLGESFITEEKEGDTFSRNGID